MVASAEKKKKRFIHYFYLKSAQLRTIYHKSLFLFIWETSRSGLCKLRGRIVRTKRNGYRRAEREGRTESQVLVKTKKKELFNLRIEFDLQHWSTWAQAIIYQRTDSIPRETQNASATKTHLCHWQRCVNYRMPLFCLFVCFGESINFCITRPQEVSK